MQDQIEIHEELRRLIQEAALRNYLSDARRYETNPPPLSMWMRWPYSDPENLAYTNRHGLDDEWISRPFEEAAIAAGNGEEVATACHAITELALDEIESGRLDERASELLLEERGKKQASPESESLTQRSHDHE